MDDKYRMTLIREGNKLFNEGNHDSAMKNFMKANYTGGLLRIADYYFYDLKRPLNALPLYMKCGSKERINEIHQRMAFALGKMIQGEKKESDTESSEVNDLIEKQIKVVDSNDSKEQEDSDSVIIVSDIEIIEPNDNSQKNGN